MWDILQIVNSKTNSFIHIWRKTFLQFSVLLNWGSGQKLCFNWKLLLSWLFWFSSFHVWQFSFSGSSMHQCFDSHIFSDLNLEELFLKVFSNCTSAESNLCWRTWKFDLSIFWLLQCCQVTQLASHSIQKMLGVEQLRSTQGSLG